MQGHKMCIEVFSMCTHKSPALARKTCTRYRGSRLVSGTQLAGMARMARPRTMGSRRGCAIHLLCESCSAAVSERHHHKASARALCLSLSPSRTSAVGNLITQSPFDTVASVAHALGEIVSERPRAHTREIVHKPVLVRRQVQPLSVVVVRFGNASASASLRLSAPTPKKIMYEHGGISQEYGE